MRVLRSRLGLAFTTFAGGCLFLSSLALGAQSDSQAGVDNKHAVHMASGKNQTELKKGVVEGNQPTTVKVNASGNAIGENAVLRFTVSPTAVSQDEPYIVVVSTGNLSQAAGQTSHSASQHIGSFSFYSPPQLGKTQTFYMSLSKNAAEELKKNQNSLNVSLVPADPTASVSKSALRILDAQIIKSD